MESNKTALSQEELVLVVLGQAKKIMGKTKMQKLLFLVQNELPNEEFKRIFDFRPYYYGPFSREIYDTISDMQTREMLRIEKRKSEKAGNVIISNDYVLTEKGKSSADIILSKLDSSTRFQLRDIIRRYNFENLASLLEYVYDKYPNMAERTEWKGDR